MHNNRNKQSLRRKKEKKMMVDVKITTHPGRILRKEMNFRGVTAARLAKQIGVKTAEITAIFNEEADITAELATLIEAATNLPAHVFVKMQHAYNEWKAEQNKELQAKATAIRRSVREQVHLRG